MKVLALCERAGIAGGMETYIRTVDAVFSRRRIEHRIVTRPELQWSDEHEAGSDAAALRLRSMCEQFRPDVIALHNVLDAKLIAAARECALTMAYHIHDHRLFCPNGDRVYPQGGGRCSVRMGAACAFHALVHGCVYGPRPGTLQLIEIRKTTLQAALEADAIVAYSHFMAGLARCNGAAAQKLHVFRPPLDAAFLQNTKEPDFGKPRVLFSGRAVPTKGLRSLIRAVSTIDPDRRPIVAIAGDGPDLASSVALAQAQSCRTEVYGKLDRDGVIAAIDRSMMVAMPSLWDEPFGLSGIEAFARGRPVVAYRTGGIGEWIGKGGFAVAPRDERALANAISSLLDRPTWARCAAAASVQARLYDADEYVDALLSAYNA